MIFSVKRIWLMFTAAAMLLGWNIQGTLGDGFNIPNPLIENEHLKDQSLVNCAEKRIFKMLNVSIRPRKLEHCGQSATVKASWILSEDILYIECYGSAELNGVQIGASTGDTDVCRDGVIKCPMLKGKLYEHHATAFPLPCIMNKGEYQLKVFCKNRDDAIILCWRWKFTWV